MADARGCQGQGQMGIEGMREVSAEQDPFGLRKMTDKELCEWIADWNGEKGIGQRLLGQHELQRRLQRPDAIRSWLAIAISVFGVFVSVALQFLK
jgi:hypothetical protein